MNKWISALLACVVSSTVHAKQFDWKLRGVNPYMGEIPAAMDDYADVFTASERKELKRRMAAREYDDIVEIRRDTIQGKYAYAPTITRMHSGSKGVANPTRTSWAEDDIERGLTYCVAERCVVVPTVCRNVALITRLPERTPTPPPVVPTPYLVTEETPPTYASPSTVGLPANTCDCFAGYAGGAGYGYPVYVGGYYFGGGGGYFVEGHGYPPVTLPIPEPSTWALLLAGLAVITWKAHDRRKHKHS